MQKKTSTNQFIAMLTIILGAGLLFGMEPMVGRMVTPFFGGAAHVWNVCMMVFQGLLLLAYLYTHLVGKKIGVWHIPIAALGLLNIPLRFETLVTTESPLVGLTVSLLAKVALPFFALATTATIVQWWFATSEHGKEKEPYRLYVFSNIGSLFVLLAYPLVVEPFLGLKMQSSIWSVGFICYLGSLSALFWRLKPQNSTILQSNNDTSPLEKRTLAIWLLLSALPATMLLGVTNLIAMEVGSFSLVWVIPLALYLGSFVVAFRAKPLPSWMKKYRIEIILALTAGVPLLHHILGQLWVYGMFFLTCWTSHSLLYERRPPVAKLTNFYVALSLGGFLGGTAATLGAPLLFNGIWEFPVSAVALAATFLLANKGLSIKPFWKEAGFFETLARTTVHVSFAIAIVLLVGFKGEETVFRHRNFYGTYTLVNRADGEPRRIIRHGATIHGVESLKQSERGLPVSYYGAGGPLSEVVQQRPQNAKIAVLGLGSGTLAAYTAPGDKMVFYEIDSDNETIAKQWFSYMNSAKGDVSVRVGDGRLLLENERDRTRYDLMFMDAFSGDGIPAHLVTQQALNSYLERLEPNGLLVVHVSNRYYELRRVLKTLAKKTNLLALHKSGSPTIKSKTSLYSPSSVVVLANNQTPLSQLKKLGWKNLRTDPSIKAVDAWTDNYVNVLSVIRIESLF